MNLSYGPTEIAVNRSSASAADTRLQGHWLILARTAWLAVAVIALTVLVVIISFRWAQLSDLPADLRTGLAQLGLSIGGFAVYSLSLEIILRATFFAVGLLLFWRKSDEWMALFVSLTLVTIGATPDNETITALAPPWRFLADLLGGFGWTSIWILLYLFPDGRFVPRWTRLLAAVFVIGQALEVLSSLFPHLWFNTPTWLQIPEPVVASILLGSCLFAQIYRYRRVSGPVQRQQTKWFVFGVTIALSVGVLVNNVFSAFFPSLDRPGSLYALVAQTILVLTLPLIPLSIGIAVLRYRLWDIDLIINRTLVYGALTASVVGLYVLVVGLLGTLLQARGNFFISLLATGLIASLFQPLRERLQRGVNRLMYGERDEPYTVISRLGQRLDATLAPQTVLPTIVATVKEALKLPYTAIALDQDGICITAVAAGTLAPNPLCLPLSYQGETIGQLILSPRVPGELFTPAERRLLDDLAHQAGIAAAAVRLTTDLQRARERLVLAREEERRRLRRDLHDGLGPQLAGLTLKLETARNRLAHDPLAGTLLADLIARTQAAVADIRRLVYALRPPALDELGLVAALRQGMAQYSYQDNGLCLTLDAPEELPPLPAAVEVAAYRIVQEALTNVVRHAAASTCAVRLTCVGTSGWLCLEVQDDGCGLPAVRGTGVGLNSMRERAEELGGTWVIEPVVTGGTRVYARLPLSLPEPSPQEKK